MSAYSEETQMPGDPARIAGRQAGGPLVGIFWFIQEPGEAPKLVAFSGSVQDGETYRVYINYPEEHVHRWREVGPHLPASFLDCGPKDWPRGRVLFNTVVRRFEVILDKQLQTPQLEAEILDYFGLPGGGKTSFASDPHYADARYELGPEGPRARAA